MRRLFLEKYDRPFLSYCLELIFLIFLAIFVTGCFFKGSSPAFSVETAVGLPPEWSSEQLSSEPHLYKVKGKGMEFFVSTVKGCGFKDYIPTKAINRELFIGFSDLTLESNREQEILGSKFNVSLLSAKLDDTPVRLLAYSTRIDKCVIDTVLWSSTDEILTVPMEAIAPFLEYALGLQ